MSKRDDNGRLNMDVVREDENYNRIMPSLPQENVSNQYTAEWLERVAVASPRLSCPDKDTSTTSQKRTPPVTRSAPAMSVRSRRSNSSIKRSKLELQLKQLKERQQLEKETQYLEIEIRKQELELEKRQRLAELAQKKELQKMEAMLAQAELIEQFETSDDEEDLDSEDGIEEHSTAKNNDDMNDGGKETEQRNAEVRETEQSNAEVRETEERNVEVREAELREKERRETELREREQREAQLRVTEVSEVQLRDTRRCGVERPEVEQTGVIRRQAERKDRERTERGTEADRFQDGESSRARTLGFQQLRSPREVDTNTFIPQGSTVEQPFLQEPSPNVQRPQRSNENVTLENVDSARLRMDQQRSLPPSFVPGMYPNGMPGFERQYENVYYPYQQFNQPMLDSRQVFEQQQQAMRLMATAIGSTISKGFEMPKREYMTFDGNPLKYPSFIQNFKTNVEDIERDPNSRRNFLIQLCTGKAKDAISGTVMLPPEEGYCKAKSILREMFGQTHIVAASHIDRVTKGGTIKEFESDKLLQLARDMENCEMNLSRLGYHADINSRSNMSAIVLRLPKYIRSEWAKEAQNSRDQGKEPDFSQLTKFVVKKAKLANTEYGRLINAKSDNERERKNPRFDGRARRVSSFVGFTGEQDSREVHHVPGKKPFGKLKCYFCEKDGHTIERCFAFQEKSYDDRKMLVSKKGLCNLCLSKGHFANQCKKQYKCFIPGCGKKHHPMLHPIRVNQDQKDSDAQKEKDGSKEKIASSPINHIAQTGHCGATGTTKKRVCLRVIPVKVFGRDNGIEKVTYAIRDEGSNTTLVKESLAEELRLNGQSVKFQLTTMNGVSQESGQSYSFFVQGLGQKDCLEISNALSVKDLTVAKSCNPSEEDVAKWRHFDGISVPKLESSEVTILIGADIPEAHWKLEERRGRKKEPYAVRTPLGWSVADPLGTTPDNNVSSFFIRQEDEFLSETVDQMFKMDFSESTYSPNLSMSLEDQKALTVMESSLKIDGEGHYQLDLPFREKPDFPNNRRLAERRLRSLKMRLKKDEDLYAKYKAGINEYVDKRYATKIESSEVEDAGTGKGHVWYLPHHPVQHPQKPSKPRIVFDCAAKYDDVSLNSKLLQGPDMTNTLVGYGFNQ